MRLRPGDIVVPIAWMCQIIGRNETLDSNYHVAWWPEVTAGTGDGEKNQPLLGIVISARARKFKSMSVDHEESFVLVNNVLGWVDSKNLRLLFRRSSE